MKKVIMIISLALLYFVTGSCHEEIKIVRPDSITGTKTK